MQYHDVVAVENVDEVMLLADSPRPGAAAAHEAFTTLQAVAVEHLDHEEAEFEPVCLSKRDDPAINAMGRQFAKISPPVAGTFFAWVTDGATPEELASVKKNVPGPVLAIIGGIFGRK